MTTTYSPAGTAATQAKPADRFLRIVLRVDAIASGITGAAFVGTGKLHEDLFGLPPALTLPAGLALLVFAAALWITATRPRIAPAAAWTIIALNALWVAASVTVLTAGWLALTGLGIAYVALQAAAVAVFAELEFVGLRRTRR